MVKTLVKSVREYKKHAILTPVCMILEVVCECLIPMFMTTMMDYVGDMPRLLAYGGILILMAAFWQENLPRRRAAVSLKI